MRNDSPDDDLARELTLLNENGAEAVAELFSKYRDKLQRMVRFRLDSRLQGRVDADDVLQDSYVEASRRIGDYVSQPSVPFFIWLRQITAQILIDAHRRHLGAQMRDVKQEVALHRRSPQATSISLAARLVGNLTTPSRAAMREELVNVLRDALDNMEPIDREVLVLRHLEELSNNEVADVLEIDKYAASKRYLRALKRLQKVMANLCGEEIGNG